LCEILESIMNNVQPFQYISQLSGLQKSSSCKFVSGPYQLNGVPLRRVSQTYVIATQTKVDLAGFVVPEKFNDAYFKRIEAKKTEGESVFKESEQVRTDKLLQLC